MGLNAYGKLALCGMECVGVVGFFVGVNAYGKLALYGSVCEWEVSSLWE